MSKFIKICEEAWFFPKLIYLFGYFLSSTIKVERINEPKDQNKYIFVIWHHFLIPATFSINPRLTGVLAGDGLDAIVTAKVLENFGFEVINVNKSKTKSALASSIEYIKTVNNSLLIAVDGGRGPSCRVKKGAILIAKKTNRKIIPIRIKCSFFFRLPTWDRSFFPLPFSKIRICFEEAIELTKSTDNRVLTDDEIQVFSSKIQRALESTNF